MIKKAFFNLSEPSFNYESLNFSKKIKQIKISKPNIITLYLREVLTKEMDGGIRIGTRIKKGQKVYLSNQSETYAISSLSGEIENINPVLSDHGISYTAISIKADNTIDIDESFKSMSNIPSLRLMADFLQACPGEPPISHIERNIESIKKIVIYGGNSDLLVNHTIKSVLNEFSSFNRGVKYLKDTTGIKNISLIIPQNTIQSYSDHSEATIRTVPNRYPQAEPLMISYKDENKIQNLKSINTTFNKICFLKSEAVLAIGKAFENKRIPTSKTVTVLDGNSSRYLIKVKIGTHINHILKELKISINEGDKIIFGGPMTGICIHSQEHPILPSTEVIIIQRKEKISNYDSYSCINCGSCIRVCPANVPVNLLVRFLEAGQYQDSAELYDLFSCIECGLCSCVCISKIPILQYIKLAKYELDRTTYAEEMNE